MDARTIGVRSIDNPGANIERVLSQSLFSEIKPHCIELSQTALLPSRIFKPDSPRLISALAALESSLESHYQSHKQNGPYRLSANIADYVFFPISNLLKQPALSDPAVAHILYIIGFLVKNAWSQNINLLLIDQLLPLVVYLSGGKTIASTKTSEIVQKTLSFKRAAVACFSNLIEAVPSTYFAEGTSQRLSCLGDSTTILLDVLTSLSGTPATQENNEVAILILESLQKLYSHKVSPEQTSYVFPGLVSKVINFATVSQKSHFSVIISTLKLLQSVIITVFSDSSLQIQPLEHSLHTNLHDLNRIWEESDKEHDSLKSTQEPGLYIKLQKDTNKHRSESWLKATSKQLKLSLTVFFKDLLNTPSKKHKVHTKRQLFEQIMSFQKALLSDCFYSLFLEYIPLSLDIMSLTIAAADAGGTEKSEYSSNSIKSSVDFLIETTSFDQNKTSLLHSQLKVKIEDLIENKMGLVFFSADDERIHSFLVSLKFHFCLLDSIAHGHHEGQNQTQSLIERLIMSLKGELVNSFVWSNERRKKADKNDLLDLLGGSIGSEKSASDSNKLDEIELPPHINAKQIAKVNHSKSQRGSSHDKRDYSMNLALLAQEWKRGDVMEKGLALESHYFKGSYSKFIESQIVEIIQYLTSFKYTTRTNKSVIELLLATNDEDIDPKNFQDIIEKGISLWMANSILNKPKNGSELNNDEQAFDIDNYIQFEHEDDQGTISNYKDAETDDEDLYYLVMAKSQEIIDSLNDPDFLSTENVDTSKQFNPLKVYETAYAIAIDSMGVLSNHLKYEDFQSDYLIYYFFSLLEALTYNTNPLIQMHAAASLTEISNNYSQGSLKELIMQNSDYLIDSFSSKLSIPSSLTPSLPGILFIILKISGMSLLQSNQLQDILSHMFILIDSYHGYSILVEGFFMVFEEIIKQINDNYTKGLKLTYELKPVSNYKPWGLGNLQEMLTMIHDSPEQTDFAMKGFDSSKEYFTRKKPNMPFGDEDSDDESDEESGVDENEPAEPEDKWVSPIPKNIYLTAQQIFNYGFRLLLHPSVSLRLQILKTLKGVYSSLSTDYKLVMPLIAQHWPVLLTMIAGSPNLAETEEAAYDKSTGIFAESLISPSLELMIEILDVDGRQSQPFLGSKFLDAWKFLSMHSKAFSSLTIHSTVPTQTMVKRSSKKQASLNLHPKILALYVRFLVKGLNSYERRIPDTVRYDILKVCSQFGIPPDEPLNRDIKNCLWVIQRQKSSQNTHQQDRACV